MIRPFILAYLITVCVAFTGCQSYSSGLVQTAARSDEAVVFSNLRSIMTAQNAYNLSTGNYGTFDQLTEGGYLDARFKGEKPVLNEYVYSITTITKTAENPLASYSISADPARTGDRTGRHFFMDSTSTDIHVNNTQPATPRDEVIKP